MALQIALALMYILPPNFAIRELKQTATRTSLEKRFNEVNDSCAGAF